VEGQDGEESLDEADDDSVKVGILITIFCWLLGILVKMAGWTASKSKATTGLRRYKSPIAHASKNGPVIPDLRPSISLCTPPSHPQALKAVEDG
jgi:hypothetical protein